MELIGDACAVKSKGARTWIVAGLASVAVGCASPPARPADEPSADLDAPARAIVDEVARDVIDHGQVSGISIAVLRGDRVVVARGYGLADREHQVATTENTVYPVGSITKQFRATALMRYVERGAASLDDPLAKHLTQFPDARVRIRHVLSHTAGLGVDVVNEDDVSFKDLAPLAFAPGTHWRYANRGDLITMRVVEKVSGRAWGDVLKSVIALPLHLEHTGVCDAIDPSRRAHLYEFHDKGFVPSGLDDENMARVHFVCADALDLARFELSFDRETILKKASIDAMRAPTTLGDGDDTVKLRYGLFTRIVDLDGHRAFGHTGAFDGVVAAAFRYPDDDLTIVVLENSRPKHPFGAVGAQARIARNILGLPAPTIPTLAIPPEIAAACVGRYEDGPLHLFVKRQGEGLVAGIEGGPQINLVYAGKNVFLGTPDGVDPDSFNELIIAGGRARWAVWSSRYELDGVARRTGD